MDRYALHHNSRAGYLSDEEEDDGEEEENLDGRHQPIHYTEDDQRRLERKRNSNDQKLKARLEHIFRKYDHDFTGVGDEIDIASGRIVVDNGHLQYMRHEVDPGRSASSRFVRTFQDTLEQEDDFMMDAATDSEEDDDDEEVEYDEDDEGDNLAEHRGQDSHTMSAGYRENSLYPRRPAKTATDWRQSSLSRPLSGLTRPAPRLARILVDQETPRHSVDVDSELVRDAYLSRESTSKTLPVMDLLQHVPHIQDSVRTLRPVDTHRAADPDTIHALGASIANQLAQLMADPNRKKKKKKEKKKRNQLEARYARSGDPLWSCPDLADRGARRKRHRTSSPIARPLLLSPRDRSPGQDSLWAPEQSDQAPKRRRRRDEMGTLRYRDTPNPLEPDDQTPSYSVDRSGRGDVRRCWNCSVTNTTITHQGPHGQDLCFSCAKYYLYHRRMKPFDSPTPSLGEDEQYESVQHQQLERVRPNDEDEDGDVEHAATDGHVAYGGTVGHPGAGMVVAEMQPIPSIGKTSNTSRVAAATSSNVNDPIYERNVPAGVEVDQQTTSCSTNTIATRSQEAQSVQATQRLGPIEPTSDAQTPRYLANTSRFVTTTPRSGSRQFPWTVQEDALLIRLREEENLIWENIGPYLPTRSLFAMQTRYSNKLHKGESPGREFLHKHPNEIPRAGDLTANTSVASDQARVDHQDKHLHGFGQDTKTIWPEAVNQRTPTTQAVEQPYSPLTGLQDLPSHHTHDRKLVRTDSLLPVKASQVRDRFTAEEDALIVRLKEIERLSWSSIAQRCPGRQLHTIQKRYSSRLAPDKRRAIRTVTNDPVKGTVEDRILAVDPELAGSGSAKPFEPAEDELIRKLKEEQGLNWDMIAERTPDRTPDAIQHRYEYKFSALKLPPVTRRHARDHSFRQIRSHVDELGNQSTVLKLDRYKRSSQHRTGSRGGPRQSLASTTETAVNLTDLPLTAASHVTLPAITSAVSTKPGPGSRNLFTKAEDDLILHLKQEGHDWEEIALSLPGRSVRSIAARYTQTLHSSVLRPTTEISTSPCESRSQQAPPGVSPLVKRSRQSLPLSISCTPQSYANPLLRKALGNSLRRWSDLSQHNVAKSVTESSTFKGSEAALDRDVTDRSRQPLQPSLADPSSRSLQARNDTATGVAHTAGPLASMPSNALTSTNSIVCTPRKKKARSKAISMGKRAATSPNRSSENSSLRRRAQPLINDVDSEEDELA